MAPFDPPRASTRSPTAALWLAGLTVPSQAEPREENAERGRPPSRETFYERKRAAIVAFEREYFIALTRRCNGNVSEMARQSGMKRHHVRAFLRRHGIYWRVRR